METIIGRLTSNALVKEVNDKTVVIFSVALNSYVKTGNNEEGRQYTTYVNCSYWVNTGVAKLLTKGRMVHVGGRLYVTSYLSGDEPKASLNCHVEFIKLLTMETSENAGKHDDGSNGPSAEVTNTESLPF